MKMQADVSLQVPLVIATTKLRPDVIETGIKPTGKEGRATMLEVC